jgi:glycosyltransferase involved in cell wall biosynthesis
VAQHYDLAISAFYALEGARIVWNGIPVFPGMGQDFGNSFLLQHAKDHFGDLRGGIVLTLMDVFVLQSQMCAQTNLAAWVPIDHEPPVPAVTRFFKESGAVPIAMSRFGESQLKDVGLEPLYVPHGVDVQAYKPYDKSEVRKEVGIPKDAFLVGMVAANKGRPSRKGFQQAFEAFRIFRQKHDEAILYLHTCVDPEIAYGEDLDSLAAALGIRESVVVAPRYRMLHDPFPPDVMGQLYSSLDVLLNCSMGEGFGIPVLEANACGVPSVVTNFSAMPEVAGEHAWHVGCRPFWTPGNSWQAVADVPEIVDALEQCYGLSNRQQREISEAARRHALKYSADKVMEEHFLPALAEVEERFEERKPLEAVAA